MCTHRIGYLLMNGHCVSFQDDKHHIFIKLSVYSKRLKLFSFNIGTTRLQKQNKFFLLSAKNYINLLHGEVERRANFQLIICFGVVSPSIISCGSSSAKVEQLWYTNSLEQPSPVYCVSGDFANFYISFNVERTNRVYFFMMFVILKRSETCSTFPLSISSTLSVVVVKCVPKSNNYLYKLW